MTAAEDAALAPFEAEGGENPYTIQHDLQQTMNDLVGIIRTADELEQSLEEIEELKERAKHLMVEGHRQYNPGWHLSIDMRNMLLVSRVHREGGAGPAGVAWRPHPRRLPGPDPEWGAKNLVLTLNVGRRRRGPGREAAAGDAGRAQDVLRGQVRSDATWLR